MKLQEFLSGTAAEKNAANQLKALEKKKAMSSKEQARFEEAMKLVRGRMIRVGATVGAILAGVAVYVASETQKKEETPSHAAPIILAPENSNPSVTRHGSGADATEKEIQSVDEFIHRAEEGMARLDFMTQDGRVKQGSFAIQQLNGPFEAMKINAQNPNRNGVKFRKEMIQRGESGYRIENTYYFGYSVEELNGVAAAFSPMEREMVVSPELDPDNLLDMLVVYHEVSHAVQDGNARKMLKSQEDSNRYMAFYSGKAGEKPRMIINEEGSAYAREIEMLNILLKGALKESVVSGRKLDVSSLQKALHSRTEQNGTLEMLIELANAYYPEGMTSGNLPKKFLDIIAALYRRQGYELYIPTTSGRLRIYE